ncbi:hypothetical protein YC2023_089209 [Brassica napus]
MLVLGLSTQALPVDCSGDFGPRGLSVQYTQDVCGCLSAHTGRPCVSISSHRTSMAVHVCPCVFVSTHETSVSVYHTHRTSVGVRQDTQDVYGCPCVSVSTHTGCPWLSICTHISRLVLGLSTLALPVDCSGDFGPCKTSARTHRTSASTHRTSASTHRTSVAVRVCPCVSVSTHRTSVAFHQYTYQHAGPWTQHAGPSRGMFGTSVCVRHHTQDIHGCPCMSVSTHMKSVAVHQCTYQHVGLWNQHADPSGGLFGTSVAVLVLVCVRVCPSAHTGRPWLSISTHIRTLVLRLSSLALLVDCSGDFGPCALSVQYTQDVRGCPSAHTGRPTHISTLVLGLSTLTLPVDCSGYFGPRGLSVQYTQDVRGCPSAHTGRLWLSVCVCVCPSAHTGRSWLSISTHISTLVLGLSTLALLVDCSGDFGPRGLSVQYTQDGCGCLSAHTGGPCVFVSTHRTAVAVRVCSFVSVSTHEMSMAVHQYTYQHVGPWTQHADPSRGLFKLFWPTWAICSVRTGRPWVSASTHRTSMAVRVCPCVSVSTHRTSVAVHHTHRTSVGVRQHTGRLWVSVSTHRTSVAVRVCLCVFVSTHNVLQTGRPWMSISTHRTSVAVRVCLCVSVSTDVTSVAVHQYTYQNAGRPCVSVSSHRTSMAVRVFPCVSVTTHETSVSVHQYAYQHVVHTGRPWVSASTHKTSIAVRVCLCVSVSTHRISVAVHQYTYQYIGPWTQHAGPSRGLFGTHRTFVAFHQYTYQHSGPWTQHAGPTRGMFGTHRTSVAVHPYTYQHVGPWTQHADPSRGLFGTYGVSVSTHRTSVAVCQHTHISMVVLGLSTLALPLADFGEP